MKCAFGNSETVSYELNVILVRYITHLVYTLFALHTMINTSLKRVYAFSSPVHILWTDIANCVIVQMTLARHPKFLKFLSLSLIKTYEVKTQALHTLSIVLQSHEIKTVNCLPLRSNTI